MIIAGTIKNSVNLASMDSKWQQKKKNLIKNNVELTAEERQLQRFQEEIDTMRESKKPAEIDAKLQAGAKLTPEEIEYLKKNNPEALREYEEVQRERENYKSQLENCKSKEEVDQLKATKMGQYMAEAKKITNSPYIPKGQKYKLMKKMLMKTSAIEIEHERFLQSLKYANLPDEEEEAEKKKRAEETNQQGENQESIFSDVSTGEDDVDVPEEIRRMTKGFLPEKSMPDIDTGGTEQDVTVQSAGTTGESIDVRI